MIYWWKLFSELDYKEEDPEIHDRQFHLATAQDFTTSSKAISTGLTESDFSGNDEINKRGKALGIQG